MKNIVVEDAERVTGSERSTLTFISRTSSDIGKASTKITGELTNQVELTGSVQKVYVTKEQELEAEKHIDDMINE